MKSFLLRETKNYKVELNAGGMMGSNIQVMNKKSISPEVCLNIYNDQSDIDMDSLYKAILNELERQKSK